MPPKSNTKRLKGIMITVALSWVLLVAATIAAASQDPNAKPGVFTDPTTGRLVDIVTPDPKGPQPPDPDSLPEKGTKPLPIKELLSNQSLAKAPEKEAVQAAIERGRPLDFLVRHKGELGRDALVGVASPAELTAGEPFKVFISSAAVVQALIENKPVIPLIERCRYYWEVPVFAQTGTPVASFRVENFQGEWQVVEVGGSFRETELKFLANPEQIEALLREHGIQQADAYAHFSLPPLHTDFLVFAAGGEEYFIPLLHGGVHEAWGLKSGKLYPRSAVASTVGPVLKKMRAQPDRETGIPTVASRHSPRPAWPAYTVGALLAVIAGSVFWVRRTRRG
ncbi:hypothetical protein EDD75_1124 [Thermodesulfitimonas autotrophica]|uniref:Uncharacterized protein n=1 Tax=Thermodesulfitimonas autotrophica TaxID=1894989 RepID=A0A3N5API4_9THEO|nr:hypothetical protein [Thermodesulfitimonas autotrophica]RPF46863.1 hypothetical protein EDD75_1124 [Thermodesulfitimonas autotrophica]